MENKIDFFPKSMLTHISLVATIYIIVTHVEIQVRAPKIS